MLISKKIESKKLSEVLTLLSSYVPTCRFVAIKSRAGWSQLLSSILLECVDAPDNKTNWPKLFAVSKCVLRACNREGKKQKRNQDHRHAESFDHWKAGEFGKLESEAVSMKQSKRQRTALKKKRPEQKRAYKVNLAELLKFKLPKVWYR